MAPLNWHLSADGLGYILRNRGARARFIHTGAPCPQDIKRSMIDWWGPVVYEYYGGAVTYCTSADDLARPGTVDRTLANATIRSLDKHGQDVAPNQHGEIFCPLHSLPDFIDLGLPEDRAGFGIPDPKLGEDMVMATEPVADASMTELSVLRAHLSKQLAPSLPRDAAGKLRKRDLSRLHRYSCRAA